MVGKIAKKVLGTPVLLAAGFCFTLACSTVRENGEPANLGNPTVITTDEQRQAIYDRGGTYSPQNANPIPPSEKLGLNEKASEINRKVNIEDDLSTKSPANTPTQARPEKLPNTNIDTITRVKP